MELTACSMTRLCDSMLKKRICFGGKCGVLTSVVFERVASFQLMNWMSDQCSRRGIGGMGLFRLRMWRGEVMYVAMSYGMLVDRNEAEGIDLPCDS